MIAFATLIATVAIPVVATSAAADGSPTLEWVRQLSGTNSVRGFGVAGDDSGNVYVTGDFRGTVDFDPGPGTFNMSANGRHVFVAKLDGAGNLVWAKEAGGAGFGSAQAFGVAVDSAGNVYTTGDFNGTADFDPSSAVYNLSSIGNNDMFVWKLDSAGNLAWVRRLGTDSTTTGNDARGLSVAVDRSGNVLTTGSLWGTADFNPGPGVLSLTSTGSDSFVWKLDDAGNLAWAGLLGGVGSDRGLGVDVDTANNVYVTGYFSNTADFDPGPGTLDLTAVGNDDAFTVKLDASGNLVWAKAIGGSGYDQGFGIAVDTDHNVYTSGFFSRTADLDPGPGRLSLSAAGNNDTFTMKLDAAGNLVWAKAAGGAGVDQGAGIAVDGSGSVFTTGFFEGTMDFDPGAGTFNMTAAGDRDIFVSKLDAAGNLEWATGGGGTGRDRGYGVATHKMGSIHTTGVFEGTADFGPGAGSVSLTSAGLEDVFVTTHSQTTSGVTTTPVVARVTVGTAWKSVAFTRSFETTPVVVAGPISWVGRDPVTVQVRNVTTSGFEIRLVEWPYLDGGHAIETVSYLAVERGRHVLPSGAVLEAGTANEVADTSWTDVGFSRTFAALPVVLTTVVGHNELPATVTRIRSLDRSHFRVHLQAQEADLPTDRTGDVNWMAWTKGAGHEGADGITWESQTASVNNSFHTISFDRQYVRPCVLADINSLNGSDTANLRYRRLRSGSVQIQIDEERSADSETAHAHESIGAVIFECASNWTQDGDDIDGEALR